MSELPPLEILFQDENLVAINKPSGLAVHRGWDQSDTFALQRTRDQIGQYVYPVHRLDRPTSGTLLFALNPDTARLLQEAFAQQHVQKRYIALSRGICPPHIHLDHPVPSRPKGPRVDAVTTFSRLHIFQNRYSVVSASPQTGRLHQIRRHLKHLSLHIIGDVNYGKGEHNRLFRKEYGLHRLALHALELLFPHPHTAQPLHLVAPPPDDLRAPFARMNIPPEIWNPTLSPTP